MHLVDDLFQSARKAYQRGDEKEGDRLDAEAKRLQRIADMPLTDQTEEGVADYFTKMFVGEFRYVPKFGWFRWAGSHWEQDETGEVYVSLREVTSRLRRQWNDMPKKTDEQKARAKAFGQFVSRTRSARSHDAVLKIASRDPKLVIRPGELDQQPTLLPCLNGTVDLTTGELRDAKREDLLSRVVPVEYDADAKSPQIRPRSSRRFSQTHECGSFSNGCGATACSARSTSTSFPFSTATAPTGRAFSRRPFSGSSETMRRPCRARSSSTWATTNTRRRLRGFTVRASAFIHETAARREAQRRGRQDVDRRRRA